MNIAELARTVATYAPLLGAAIPVPGGEILGLAIANAFGGDVKKPDDLISKIQVDPEAAFKLLALQANNNSEIEKILFSDRQDARRREIEYIEKTGVKDYTLKNLSYITTAGFFAVLFMLFYPGIEINEQENHLVLVLLGMLASKWQTIIDYYFGSSQTGNPANKK